MTFTRSRSPMLWNYHVSIFLVFDFGVDFGIRLTSNLVAYRDDFAYGVESLKADNRFVGNDTVSRNQIAYNRSDKHG